MGKQIFIECHLQGLRPQFCLLEKKIVRAETDMMRFDWLLFSRINIGG